MRVYWGNLKKLVGNGAFWVTVILLYLLCFTTQIGNKDNGDPIALIEYFMDWSDGMLWRIPGEDVSLVFSYRGGGWLQLFLPLLGSWGVVYLYGLEKATTFQRYEVFRTGKYRHRTGRFLAASTVGGLQLGVAYTLFILTIILRYGLLVQVDWKYIVVLVGEMFLYGALYTMPALLLSVWIQNVYLVTSLSLLMLYIPERISQRLVGMAISDSMNIDTGLLNLAFQINPARLGELCTEGAYQKVAIVEAVALFSVCFGSYVLFMKEEIC